MKTGEAGREQRGQQRSWDRGQPCLILYPPELHAIWGDQCHSLHGSKSERGSPGASLSDTMARKSRSLSFHVRNSPAGVRALLVSLVTPSAHCKPSQGSGSLPYVDGPVYDSFSLCLCWGGWVEG